MSAIHIPRRGELGLHADQAISRAWRNGLIEAFTPHFAARSLVRPSPAQMGLEWSAPSGNGAIVKNSQIVAGRDEYTIVALVRPQGAGFSRAVYCERASGTGIVKFGPISWSPNHFSFVWRNTAGNLINETVVAALDTTKLVNTTAFVVNGSASRTIYADKSYQTSTTNYPNTITDAQIASVCGDYQDAGAFYAGGVLAVVLFSRALSFAELDALSDDPWQLFRADPIRIYSLPSGPITLNSLTMSAFTSSGARATLGIAR